MANPQNGIMVKSGCNKNRAKLAKDLKLNTINYYKIHSCRFTYWHFRNIILFIGFVLLIIEF
jgi:hypothetical protein